MIACMRVADGNPSVPQALVRFCYLCAEPVWISSVLVHRVDSGEMDAICLRCLPGILTTTECEAALHPDQLQELRDLGVLEYAQRFILQFNRQHGST